MMPSRLDTGPVATWWWTIDRYFLSSFLCLMSLGIVLSFAAGSSVAERVGLDTFHFAERQAIFMVIALVVMLLVSFLGLRSLLVFSAALLLFTLVLMCLLPFWGAEIKGSQRWISLAGFSVQPSEFLKPAFVVVCGWLFSFSQGEFGFLRKLIAFGLLVCCMALLILQPDLGQMILVFATWSVMFFLSGVPWLPVILLGFSGIGSTVMAYLALPHVAGRINRFITGEGDLYQVNTGMLALVHGGWFGVGPGEGTIKRLIPDGHADFIFAVAGEEFGILLCLVIACFFAFIVLRGLKLALHEKNPFVRCSLCGLVTVFGLQSVINMGVNLHILPSKGMTLPFISYGGSSLVAVALSMGMVLSLTRRSPEKLRNPKLSDFSSSLSVPR